MDLLGIGTAVQGLANTVGSIINTNKTNRANRELAQYQFWQNQRMARDANKWNIEQWEREMAYNTPKAQMQRLKQGGLNPNLVYGTGSVTGNTSGRPPKSEVAQYQRPQIDYNYKVPSVMAMFQDAKVKQAQTNNINADTVNTDARTLTEGIKQKAVLTATELNTLKKNLFESTMKYQQDAKKAEFDILEQKLKNLKSDNQIKKTLRIGYRDDNKYKKYKAELAEKGINLNDPLWLRQLQQWMQNNKIGAQELFEMGVNKIVEGVMNAIY